MLGAAVPNLISHAASPRGAARVAAMLALLAGARDLRAQTAEPGKYPVDTAYLDAPLPPRREWLPRIGAGSNDGPVFLLHGDIKLPAEYDDRVAYRQLFTADAGVSTKGSRFLAAQWHAPRIAPGWRVLVALQANRENRFGYYGLGNTGYAIPADLLTARVRRTRYEVRADLTRTLWRPGLKVALGVQAQQAERDTLAAGSYFAADFGGAGVRQSDLSARLALVFDARDTEFNPSRGALLEAGVQAGSGGGGYQRGYAVLRGWVPIRDGLTVALRTAGSMLTSGATLEARSIIPAWERPIDVLGNETSARAFAAGRWTGRGVLLGTAELRWDALYWGDIGALLLTPFVETGRVFENEGFQLTTDGLHTSAGLGVGFRFLRTNVTTVQFATGAEGFRVTALYGWQF